MKNEASLALMLAKHIRIVTNASQVVFPALLPLTYIPALLQRVKQLFLSLFSPYLRSLIDSLTAGSVALSEASGHALRIVREKLKEEQWDRIFDRCLKGFEGTEVSRRI